MLEKWQLIREVQFHKHELVEYLSLVLRKILFSLQIAKLLVQQVSTLFNVKRCPGYDTTCIWWWGFSSRDLGSVEHFFIAITSCSTLIWTGSTCLSLISGLNKSVWDNKVFTCLKLLWIYIFVLYIGDYNC